MSMSMTPSHGPLRSCPSVYQINTRIFLHDLTLQLHNKATLDNIPDSFFDALKGRYDFVYFLGVWQTGPRSRAVSRNRLDWLEEWKKDFPDLDINKDITGSPFAIQSYTLHSDFGNEKSLKNLKKRLQARDLKLILDFVPNHTGLDHSWIEQHPDYYVHGTEQSLHEKPQNYIKFPSNIILAHGRDPNFDGWTDTLQLNYRHPSLRLEMIKQLLLIAVYADGVRCDMAMLLLPDIFLKTWGDSSLPKDGSNPVDDSFWKEAIATVKSHYPKFLFTAEVYWNREWELQQQGFDYTYDKTLYDRLKSRIPAAIKGHLKADEEYQYKSVRFLENHDEPRAAHEFPELHEHIAAAVITYLVPGMRFFHEGQFMVRLVNLYMANFRIKGRKIQVPVHLGNRKVEEIDKPVQQFYASFTDKVLCRPEVRVGTWKLLETRPAWPDNPTFDNYVCFMWHLPRNDSHTGCIIVLVNYSKYSSQCYVDLSPIQRQFGVKLQGKLLFKDLMHPITYERDGTEILEKGLFLDEKGHHSYIFEVLRG